MKLLMLVLLPGEEFDPHPRSKYVVEIFRRSLQRAALMDKELAPERYDCNPYQRVGSKVVDWFDNLSCLLYSY
jgi:hypothetical protein